MLQRDSNSERQSSSHLKGFFYFFMISSGFKLEICTFEATSLQTGVANAHGPSPWGKGP